MESTPLNMVAEAGNRLLTPDAEPATKNGPTNVSQAPATAGYIHDGIECVDMEITLLAYITGGFNRDGFCSTLTETRRS